MSFLDPEVVKTLETLFSLKTIDRSCNASALTLYVWEFFLTLPDEVEYFWGAPWTFIKFLFFVNRYFTLLLVIIMALFDLNVHPTKDICFAWATFAIFAGISSAFVVEVILQVRLYALYRQNKTIILVVSTLFVVQITTMITIALSKLKPDAGLLMIPGFDSHLPICSSIIPDKFFAFWIPVMTFDFILLVLVTSRAIVHHRSLSDNSWSSSVLMSILVRDSLFYFVCNFSIFLITTLVWLLGPSTLFTVATSWTIVVPSTAASRVLISMRQVYRPKYDFVPSPGLRSFGPVHFRQTTTQVTSSTDNIK